MIAASILRTLHDFIPGTNYKLTTNYLLLFTLKYSTCNHTIVFDAMVKCLLVIHGRFNSPLFAFYRKTRVKSPDQNHSPNYKISVDLTFDMYFSLYISMCSTLKKNKKNIIKIKNVRYIITFLLFNNTKFSSLSQLENYLISFSFVKVKCFIELNFKFQFNSGYNH